MLNVAISVDSAVDYGPRAVNVIAAACEEVIGDRRCPVASELRPGAVAAWYALVHPRDPALSGVRIEFRDRTASGVLIEQRELTFSPRDTQESRLASVGSVIAALAAAREGPVVATSEVHREAPAPAAEPAAVWRGDLAALAAPDIGGGPSRLGAHARVARDLGVRAYALASARFAGNQGDPGYTWLSFAGGLGVRTAGPHLGIEGTAEAVFERTTVSASQGAAHDSVGQSGWGGRVGVDAAWPVTKRWAALLGVDVTMVLPRINVVVADGNPTRLSLVTAGLWAGVRFTP
jgi:hypothetical protein